MDAAADAGANYSNYNDLKQGQADNNYQYDAIGNLTGDAIEGISNISWNVYGKIVSITKSGAVIRYVYDGSGNRIMKQTAADTTIYVRDASGNVLSVYVRKAGQSLFQTETHLYGSSRLGMATQHMAPDSSVVLSGGFGMAIKSIFARGEKLFELPNHLGNVLVTITDRRVQNSAGGVTVDYYAVDIATANDYYPFGMPMPSRNYTAANGYRYGFNGKENDNEVKGMGDHIDYGMRVYDPRMGKFLSVDPLTQKYPELTPYQFASNFPIAAIDLDGEEAKIAIAGSGSPLKKPYGPGGTDYMPSDIEAFQDRSNNLKRMGFVVSRVHSGQMIIQQFVNSTLEKGSILQVITYTHSGGNGLYLDNNGGFYSANGVQSGTNFGNIRAVADLVKSGQIKFEKNAVWIFASCNCGNPNYGSRGPIGDNNIAEDAARELGIVTYGATDKVEPEFNKKGQETGRLTTHGTFIRFTPVDVQESTSVTRNRRIWGIPIPFTSVTTTETTTKRVVKKEDVGHTIDPRKIFK